MAWAQFARILTVASAAFGIVTGFQNCSSLDEPTGTAVLSSQSTSDDIEFLSYPNDTILYTGDALHWLIMAQSKRNLPLNYQWQKDGVDIPGQNTAAFDIAAAAPADAGLYTLKISNTGDSDFIDVRLTISPSPVLTITTQPQPITVMEGSAGTLSVVASATPAQALTYQWYKDGTAIAGATGASYSLPLSGVARSGNYQVRVYTTVGPQQIALSNTVKVTHQQTFALGANGCVNGYCACVTPGQGYVAHQPSALAICVFKGFTNLTTFSTANGIRGANHCNADGGGCFQNAYEGNLTCSSVTCVK